MQAAIMVGGEGTRIANLNQDIPTYGLVCASCRDRSRGVDSMD